jgi:uncharacterized RDD family membrane protein YckC
VPPTPGQPYGQPPQPQYAQPQTGQPQTGQPYGQPPQPQYGQPQYGQPQYGQQAPGYAQQPPAYGQPYPAAPAYSAYGGVQTPFGPPAGMGNRLIARIIDAIIVGVPAAILVAIIAAAAFSGTSCTTGVDGYTTSCDTSGSSVGMFFLGYGIVLLLALFYEIYFIGAKGQTIGKRVMGVKVLDAQTGGPIGMGRAFVRYLVLAVTGSICTLGYWSPFFDNTKRNQGWHDKAASDFVVTVAK